MNDSIKLLTSTDTSTTTTNSNKNSSNTNSSKNNTCSELIPSRITYWWRKNASGECNNAYAAIQDVKERLQILKFRSIERRIYAYCGDSMLAGLKETKLPWRTNVRYFTRERTEDLQYHLITYLKKEPEITVRSSSILVSTTVHIKWKILYTKNW